MYIKDFPISVEKFGNGEYHIVFNSANSVAFLITESDAISLSTSLGIDISEHKKHGEDLI